MKMKFRMSLAIVVGLTLLSLDANAQTVAVICTKPNVAASTLLTIDYGQGTVTYVERYATNDSSPIVSRPNISSTQVAWAQNEPNYGKILTVNYNFNRVTGVLEYWWIEDGESKNGSRPCTLAQPKY